MLIRVDQTNTERYFVECVKRGIKGEVVESVLLIIVGDVDCSGNLNTTDYIQMRRYFVDETYSLTDSAYISADIEENGKLMELAEKYGFENVLKVTETIE